MRYLRLQALQGRARVAGASGLRINLRLQRGGARGGGLQLLLQRARGCPVLLRLSRAQLQALLQAGQLSAQGHCQAVTLCGGCLGARCDRAQARALSLQPAATPGDICGNSSGARLRPKHMLHFLRTARSRCAGTSPARAAAGRRRGRRS